MTDSTKPDYAVIRARQSTVLNRYDKQERARLIVADVPALLDRCEALEAAIERVRAFHIEVDTGVDRGAWTRACAACAEPWPCATIRALGDEAKP